MKLITQLEIARRDYDNKLTKSKAILKPFIKFDFDIEYRTDESCFCLNDTDGNMATLVDCLVIITEIKILTHTDFLKLTF